jgi:hypothetical protein
MTDERLAHYLKTQLRAALTRRDLADAAALVRTLYGVEPDIVNLSDLIADQTITALAASRRIEALALRALSRPHFDTPDVNRDLAIAWLRAKKEAAPGFSDIRTSDPATLLVLVKAIDLARQAAEWRVNKPKTLPAPVFLLGESGTGKEMLAKAMADVHFARMSELRPGERQAPARTFGGINCAGLAEDVVESELFGHAKGAFTGALADRKGLLMEHEHGVVLLDEIGDAPLERVQPRLLRFLQDGEVRPVGANRVEHAYPWIIAATNHPEQLREELQHRLGLGRALILPALRERGDDVETVLLSLIRGHAVSPTPPDVSLSHAARRALRTSPWPGNLRELDQVARDIAAQNYGQAEIHVESDDLPEDVVLIYRANTSVIDLMSDAYADYVAVAPPAEHSTCRAKLIDVFRDGLQAGSMMEVALLHRLRRLVASDLCAHWLGSDHAGLLLAFDQRLRRIEAALVKQLDDKLGTIDGVPAPPHAVLVLEPETAPKGAIFLLDLIEGWATSEDARELAQSLAEIQGHLPPAWQGALSALPSLLPKEAKKAEAKTAPATPPAAATASENWDEVRASPESLRAALDRYGSGAAVARVCKVASSTVTKAASAFGIDLPRGRPPAGAADENANSRDSESVSRDSAGTEDEPPSDDSDPTP